MALCYFKLKEVCLFSSRNLFHYSLLHVFHLLSIRAHAHAHVHAHRRARTHCLPYEADTAPKDTVPKGKIDMRDITSIKAGDKRHPCAFTLSNMRARARARARSLTCLRSVIERTKLQNDCIVAARRRGVGRCLSGITLHAARCTLRADGGRTSSTIKAICLLVLRSCFNAKQSKLSECIRPFILSSIARFA
jgi:hypothetical protein